MYAVRLVKGIATAFSGEIFFGAKPTIRSFTATNSAFDPDHVISPAQKTLSPISNKEVPLPFSTTVPILSQPNMTGDDKSSSIFFLTFVSMGLIEVPSTLIKRSFGLSVGRLDSNSMIDSILLLVGP